MTCRSCEHLNPLCAAGKSNLHLTSPVGWYCTHPKTVERSGMALGFGLRKPRGRPLFWCPLTAEEKKE